MGFRERQGRYPFQKAKVTISGDAVSDESGGVVGKKALGGGAKAEVREVTE